MATLPPDLTGPIGLELARAEEQVPGEKAMPGGSNGKNLTDRFPDVRAALASQVQVDCVLDGEMVVWTGQRLDFDALQRRLVNTPATVRRRLAVEEPTSFVAFDLLAARGVDLRQLPWTERRQKLETLAQDWQPPLQLSPVTSKLAEAEEWLSAFSAAGVEGLVVKGASSRYHPGRRGWLKVKHRQTVEAIVGAVTGTLRRPEVLVVGRYRGEEFEVVGRTVTLTPDQSAEIGKLLKPAGPRRCKPATTATPEARPHTSRPSP